jgi:transposase InsO family protein
MASSLTSKDFEKFHAMTVIDACTNLVETAEGAAAVENTWLAQYPKPVHIVTDQGPEFGQDFTDMCNNNGITHSTSTSCNPQGNSLIESIRKMIAQVLQVVTAAKSPKSIHKGEGPQEPVCILSTKSSIGVIRLDFSFPSLWHCHVFSTKARLDRTSVYITIVLPLIKTGMIVTI